MASHVSFKVTSVMQLSPDRVHPVVPFVCVGCAESVVLVFTLHHFAFVLCLAGLDLLSLGVI